VRRLYLKIYAAFIGILLLFGVLLTAAWWLLAIDSQENRTLEGMGVVLGEVLPSAAKPTMALQTKVEELAALFRADLSVLTPDGAVLAESGEALPPLPADQHHSGWLRVAGGPIIALLLPDHRWVLARSHHRHRGLGLLLGLSSREIERKTGEIAAFSELGEYLHLPVRTYSAGMTLRLMFAIATSIEGNVVLMDEWLAVGDSSFRRKANERLKAIAARAGILVIASHDEHILRDTCTLGMRLEAGKVKQFGPIGEVLAERT